MKTTFCLLIFSVMVISGCEKEPITEPQTDTNTKAIKVDFSAYPETTSNLVLTMPDLGACPILYCKGCIVGEVSLMGSADMNSSSYTITDCVCLPTTDGSRKIKQTITGNITGVNGESFKFNGNRIVDFSSKSITGEMRITGGTGKFANAEGMIWCDGTIDMAGIPRWKGEGIVRFK